jgi:hypothetical protein
MTAYDRISEVLEKTEDKFNFSLILERDIKETLVYNSNSESAKKWSYPKRLGQVKWENHLVGINKGDGSEFNFVFKDGDTSDAPMSNIFSYD